MLRELLKQVSSQPMDALRQRGCSSFLRFPTPGNVDVLSAFKGADSWPWPWALGLSFLSFFFCSFSFSSPQLKLPTVVRISVDGRLFHIMTTTTIIIIIIIMPSTNWLWIEDEIKRNFLGPGVYRKDWAMKVNLRAFTSLSDCDLVHSLYESSFYHLHTCNFTFKPFSFPKSPPAESTYNMTNSSHLLPTHHMLGAPPGPLYKQLHLTPFNSWMISVQFSSVQ